MVETFGHDDPSLMNRVCQVYRYSKRHTLHYTANQALRSPRNSLNGSHETHSFMNIHHYNVLSREHFIIACRGKQAHPFRQTVYFF